MKRYNWVLTILLLTGLMGCAKKYDHWEQKRQEEATLRQEISLALSEGKAVVFSENPRRSIWVSADRKHSFSFHQELPSIGSYVAQVVEPGTYYFAGGRVEVEKPSQNLINEKEGAKMVGSVGEAHVAQIIRDQRAAEYAYRTLPVYYGSSLGYGHGYWGGRRGYWGRRHYSSPFYGMSMYTDSERTVRSKVAVHSHTSVWANNFVVRLPHDGRTGQSAKAGPLVAGVSLAPGEAVILDDVFINKVSVDIPAPLTQSDKRVLPASASSASSATMTDLYGPFPIVALEISIVPHDAAARSVVGGIGVPVQHGDRVMRGAWFSKDRQHQETVVIAKRVPKKGR